MPVPLGQHRPVNRYVSFYPGLQRFIRGQNHFRSIVLRVAIASGFTTTLIALLPFLIVLRVIR